MMWQWAMVLGTVLVSCCGQSTESPLRCKSSDVFESCPANVTSNTCQCTSTCISCTSFQLDLVKTAPPTVTTLLFDSDPGPVSPLMPDSPALTLEANIFSHLSELVELEIVIGNLALTPGMFNGLSQLLTLNLADNAFTTLQPGVFDGLHNLLHLNLQGTGLTVIPDGVFVELSRLTSLDLSNNENLITLGPQAFNGLSSVSSLQLTLSEVAILPNNTFELMTGLAQLDIGLNQISYLPTLKNLNDLRTFSADFNTFPYVEGLADHSQLESISFVGCPNLRVFPNMSGLPKVTEVFVGGAFKEIPQGAFTNDVSLQTLSLSSSKLSTVQSRAFHGLHSLSSLSLSGSSSSVATWEGTQELSGFSNLTHFQVSDIAMSITASTFETNSNLDVLALKKNQITQIPSGAFDALTKLTTLSLTENPLQQIAVGSFDSLTSLTVLDLQNNLLSELPSGLLDNCPLLRLILNKNVLRGTLDVTGLTSLLSLSFANNAITYLNPVPSSLTEIHAPFNAISSLPSATFPADSALNTLTLPFNRLTLLELLNLGNLTTLELANNNITKIADAAFLFMQKLETLTLRNNLIQETVGATFIGLSSLVQVLDLRHNRITKISFAGLNTQEQLTLNFDQNLLTALPALELSNIVGLSANDNLIQSVQPSYVPGLAFLSLVNNQLKDLKIIEAFLNSLPRERTNLNVPGNPSYFLELSNNPASCTLNRAPDINTFVCQCSDRFERVNGKCLPPTGPNVPLIASLSAIGGTLVGALIITLGVTCRRRFKTIKADLQLHERLLESQTQEVRELVSAWDIDQHEIELERRIDLASPGQFGQVWLAKWDGLVVAVKRLKFAMDGFNLIEFQSEIENLRKCRHRNLIRFFGAGTFDDAECPAGAPFLVTEYASVGSLSTYLRAHDDISWTMKLSFAKDIASGMAYLHALSRIHRDLKTDNVLLTAELRAKVADFGSMKNILRDTPAREQETNLMTGSACQTAGVGTPLFMAPEIIRGDKYGSSADVWSFGVVLWEIGSQVSPDFLLYHADENWSGPFLVQLEKLLVRGLRLPFDQAEPFPDQFKQVVERCWQLAPLARPRFDELCELLEATDMTID